MICQHYTVSAHSCQCSCMSVHSEPGLSCLSSFIEQLSFMSRKLLKIKTTWTFTIILLLEGLVYQTYRTDILWLFYYLILSTTYLFVPHEHLVNVEEEHCYHFFLWSNNVDTEFDEVTILTLRSLWKNIDTEKHKYLCP